MKNRSENLAGRGQILPVLQGNSRSIAQKSGEIWTGQANLQPTSFKSDRLLGEARGNLLLLRVTPHYTIAFMIKTFQHRGLQAFFETGSKAGIQPHHAQRLSRQLARLDLAKAAADMNAPGWKLHLLTGDLAGHYSVTVNGNWRMTFKFEGEDAVLVDYRD